MIETEAWVLYAGKQNGHRNQAQLRLEKFAFPEPKKNELLVEPLIGCWEGNMSHAVNRQPIDICHQRNESKVVIGNAGVVRVLQVGPEVEGLAEGDVCLVFCNGQTDAHGFPQRIWAYDAPGSVGLLARRTKLTASQLIRIPEDSKYSPAQWAAFSLRYITAWANWQTAYACWQAIAPDAGGKRPWAFGWGGGATLAELTLAQFYDFQVSMSAAGETRRQLISSLGICPLDRSDLQGLHYDDDLYAADRLYRQSYQNAEADFLKRIESLTGGEKISIIVDYIGMPVYKASLKALARPGVLTSAGWKEGMSLSTLRALECMNWHIHVHTHYARYTDGIAAVSFGEQHGWMPPETGEVYPWEDIPRLAQQHLKGELDTYFPLFRINDFG